MGKRKWLEYGGIASGVLLIAFGIGAIGMSINGYMTVNDSLKAERITSEATEGMTPDQIAEDAKAAGLPDSTPLPTCSVEGEDIDNATKARCFAEYIRVHALEAAGGLTYSELGRYTAQDGDPKGTNDAGKAEIDPETSRPVPNPSRETWVTATALSTALNVSFMAYNLALFGTVVGIALLLSGIGFVILAVLAIGRSASGAAPAEPQSTEPPAAA